MQLITSVVAAVRRRRNGIMTIFIVVIALPLGFFTPIRFSWREDAWSNTIGTTLVTTAALTALYLLRHRAPTATMLCTGGVLLIEAAVVGSTSIGSIIFLSDLIYIVAVTSRSRWVSVASILGGIATALVVIGLFLPLFPEFAMRILSLMLMLVVPIWWGRAVQVPRLEAERERERSREIERLAAERQQAAIAAERASMSRDLHDVIAGHLSAIAMQSEAALSRVGTGSTDGQERSLEAIRKASLEALGDMRAMIEVLRSDGGTASLSAPATLADYARPVASAREAGLSVQLSVELGRIDRLPPSSSIAAYRVLQEALINAQKHAGDQEVRVSIEQGDAAVRVTVENAISLGRSPSTDSSGLGILGLSERVRLAGGHFEAGQRGGDWRVFAELPALTGGAR